MTVRRIRYPLTAAVLFALAASAHGGTLYVAVNGIDPPSCGSCGQKTSPCRSISCAIVNAVAGDKIVVGPGRYGDLNGNRTLGETGEEFPTPGCGCMLSINKSVTVTSSDGAAATVIDASSVDVAKTVLIIADNVQFGRPKKGFTVTNTHSPSGAGIIIDGTNTTVGGNQVVAIDFDPGSFSGIGIDTVASNPGPILIEGNQVIGWSVGIYARGAGKTVSKNQVSLNYQYGVVAGEGVVGNVVVASVGAGIGLEGAAHVAGNAIYGNRLQGLLVFNSQFSGDIDGNNIFGNGVSTNCGLSNGYTQGVNGLPAGNNYWGAPTGPGADPADEVCNAPGGTTMVTPFATRPFKVKAPIKP